MGFQCELEASPPWLGRGLTSAEYLLCARYLCKVLYQWFLMGGHSVFRGHLVVSGDGFGSHNWGGVLLASSRYSMLPNVPQAQDIPVPLQQRII